MNSSIAEHVKKSFCVKISVKSIQSSNISYHIYFYTFLDTLDMAWVEGLID